MPTARVLVGDVRQRLAEIDAGSVQACVTSPPYWGLRDYGHDGQIGLEQTPDEYVGELVQVFREVRRVLADDGTLWLNLGDTYGPDKQLQGIPWRVAFALQMDGWLLRQDIIWAKPNPMPESVTDRCTKAHEYVFLLTKQARYLYNIDALREPTVTPIDGRGSTEERKQLGHPPRYGMAYRGDNFTMPSISAPEGGRNRRSVWSVATKPYTGAHFAVMPEALAEPCILAGSRRSDVVLDPFTGSGTVGVVALRNDRNFIGVELNPRYATLAETRIYDDGPLMNQVSLSA